MIRTIETFTGGLIDPLNPNPQSIRIEDIAHALSNVCRFAGQSRVFYSVAQHSLIVSSLCRAEQARIGLMHDAAEAYLGDLTRPVKSRFPNYVAAEAKLTAVIFSRFNLDIRLLPSIKPIDLQVCLAEALSLLPPRPEHWAAFERLISSPRHDLSISPINPRSAELLFLARARELGLSDSK